jgi:hypothetical protein
MKTSISFRATALSIFIMLCFCNLSAQENPWQEGGDSVVYTDRWVGVGTDTPVSSLEVKGLITADSIHCHGILTVGDSTLQLPPLARECSIA